MSFRMPESACILALILSRPGRLVAVYSVTDASGCDADASGCRSEAGVGAKWCLFARVVVVPSRRRAEDEERGCCARWMSMPDIERRESWLFDRRIEGRISGIWFDSGGAARIDS